MSVYVFLYPPTGCSWSVSDPVAWCLENSHNPLLERARERLLTLGTDDAERIIRLVTRRCGLALVHVVEGQVIVHYWSRPPDLRPFLKWHCLARPEVRLVLWNRKCDVLTIHESGEDFLYGDPLGDDFPWLMYGTKYERRRLEEADDAEPAPTWSITNFTWPAASRRGSCPGRSSSRPGGTSGLLARTARTPCWCWSPSAGGKGR